MNKVLFRLDKSSRVGMGHGVRCRVLAEEIMALGGRIAGVVYRGEKVLCKAPLVDPHEKVAFVDRLAALEDDAEQVIDMMRETNATTLVLDTYLVQESYQSILRDAGIRWLQFDSHAQQPFWADWVVSPSFAVTREEYEALRKNRKTLFLLGPRYACLHQVYREARQRAQVRRSLQRIFICLGGGDDDGLILKILEWIAPMMKGFQAVSVVVGSSNPSLGSIHSMASSNPYSEKLRLHVNACNVSELMLESDVGIVSAGTVSYEACAVGLPMLLVAMADNQLKNLRGWSQGGAASVLGRAKKLSAERLHEELNSLVSQPALLSSMSAAGMNLVDGLGAQRVAHNLCANPET